MLTRCPRVLALACFAWGTVSFAPPARAQSLPGDADVPALIRQLGDADFRTREEATRKLRALGKAAVPALRNALRGGDPEVCSRADSLLRQIERPRIPAGWFQNFTNWVRREYVSGGARVVDVTEGERRLRVAQTASGLEMTVTGVDAGEDVRVTVRARDPEDLRAQDPEAYAVYERVAGARSNLNLRGRRMVVPVPMPAVPMPLLPPAQRLPPGPQPPGARLLPLAPQGLPRPPADDLLDLEARVRRDMRRAEIDDAEQQAVLDALRMLRDIQQQGRLMPPDDLQAQIRKYNALSDALRQKLDELRLPGPGDALPPPARARLGVSVAAPGSDEADPAGGVRVTMVSPGCRGEKLGLKAGDTIKRVNGNAIDDPAALRRVLTETKDPLVLDVVRDGAPTVLREKKQEPEQKQ